jgi:hypothetical protein
MNAPKPVVVLVPVPVPVAQGDKGAWRKALPERHRQHKAQRPEHWRPANAPPQSDRDALKRAVEQFRDATRSQAEAALAQGRRLLAAGIV